MWGYYHTIRTTDQFVGSWEKLCQETGIQPLPTLYQHLTHIMFKKLITIHFPIVEVQSSSCETSSAVRYEEANAVRYVAGYVCRAVRENIMSCNSPLKQQLLICIWELLEDVDIDSSESEDDNQQRELSSSDWVNAVDRGGLLHVTDSTHLVFTSIENVIQGNLTLSNVKSIADGKKIELIEKVIKNEEVQFHWRIVSADMSEEVAAELLRRLAIMWITIRGYSFSKCYMELYKQRQKKITGRSKGLRKELFTSKAH